jgi:hypothetical protein
MKSPGPTRFLARIFVEIGTLDYDNPGIVCVVYIPALFRGALGAKQKDHFLGGVIEGGFREGPEFSDWLKIRH